MYTPKHGRIACYSLTSGFQMVTTQDGPVAPPAKAGTDMCQQQLQLWFQHHDGFANSCDERSAKFTRSGGKAEFDEIKCTTNGNKRQFFWDILKLFIHRNKTCIFIDKLWICTDRWHERGWFYRRHRRYWRQVGFTRSNCESHQSGQIKTHVENRHPREIKNQGQGRKNIYLQRQIYQNLNRS